MSFSKIGAIEGEQELLKNLARYSDAIKDEIHKAVKATAITVVQTATRSILRGPKSGTVYHRIPGAEYMTIRAGGEDGPPVAFFRSQGKRNLGRVHKASAPGEAPANDTGNLFSSIKHEMQADGSAIVGSTITQPDYARFLEFGTTRMAARPFLRPALDANADKYRERLKKVHDEAVKR